LDALLANFADDVNWRLIGGFADLMGPEFKVATQCAGSDALEPRG